MRAVLSGEDFAAVQAVFSRNRAAYEFLAVREHAVGGREAIAEQRRSLRLEPRCVVLEIAIECRAVAQAILDRAPDSIARRDGRCKDLRRQETRELQHVRDVVAQPGIERALDGRVGVEVHFVDDVASARQDFAHGR